MELELGIAWRIGDTTARSAPTLLFRLLKYTEQKGSLSAAAKLSNVSYRTAWNLINNWSDQLQGELLITRRGGGACLSPLGRGLVWAYDYALEQTQGVLEVTSGRIKSELDRVTARNDSRTLLIYASHCLSHNILRHLFKARSDQQLTIENSGSGKSLQLLQAGKCNAAGFHLADGDLRADFAHVYQNYFDPAGYRYIHSAKRKQGLIVKRGNPKNIRSLQDLIRDDVSMINRQTESGTRVLLDSLLARADILMESIRGYDATEDTHSAVSAQVADGAADVAIGAEASAIQFGLEFFPLAVESYYYAIPNDKAESENLMQFKAVLSSPAWRLAVGKLEGYDPTGSGQLLDATDVFD